MARATPPPPVPALPCTDLCAPRLPSTLNLPGLPPLLGWLFPSRPFAPPHLLLRLLHVWLPWPIRPCLDALSPPFPPPLCAIFSLSLVTCSLTLLTSMASRGPTSCSLPLALSSCIVIPSGVVSLPPLTASLCPGPYFSPLAHSPLPPPCPFVPPFPLWPLAPVASSVPKMGTLLRPVPLHPTTRRLMVLLCGQEGADRHI